MAGFGKSGSRSIRFSLNCPHVACYSFVMIHSISDILKGFPYSMANSLHLMNAIWLLQVIVDLFIDFSSIDNDAEKNVLFKLTYCLVKVSRDNNSSDLWIETFLYLLQQNHKKLPAMLLSAATSFLVELCDCLFDHVKR